MSLSHHPNIVRNGLVAYFDAANPKSYPMTGTTWTDLTKNKYLGTMSNVTFDPANGGSMSFNGTSSFISTNVANPGNTPIVFEFWINSSSANPIGIFDSAPSQTNVLRNAPAGSVEWWNSSPAVAMGLTANTWTHIVAVYRFATNRYIDFYRNGQLISTTAGSTTATYSWTTLRFGDINTGVNRYTGKIAVVRIYNKALTVPEVLQNYNATKSRYGY